jgi:putative tryptophan/tyrosine transport system substrate-binding protein
VRRVGVLMNFAATQVDGQSYVEAFIRGLRQLGWIEGQNLRIDLRWNAGDVGLARTFAAQLIGLMPDVILASSTTNLTELRQITSTVPIVFISITDPVAQGFVASLSHPGGNITGFSNRILDRRQMA